MRWILTGAVVGAALGLALPGLAADADRVEPVLNDDGLYTQEWFHESFLDLAEDLEEAAADGKRLAVVFEQKGCIYCTKVHTDILSVRRINDYVRENFYVVQLNLWGDREVTDFDGEVLSEKKLARKWGVTFTPTIMFFPDSLAELDGKSGRDIEVARMPGAFEKITFLSMFEWVRDERYLGDEHFQKYVMQKVEEARASGALPSD